MHVLGLKLRLIMQYDGRSYFSLTSDLVENRQQDNIGTIKITGDCFGKTYEGIWLKLEETI